MEDDVRVDEAAETQEPKEQKLFFGKYKSMEEAEEAFRANERELGETKESLDRSERLNELLSTEERRDPAPEEVASPGGYESLKQYFDEDAYSALTGVLEKQTQQVLGQVNQLAGQLVVAANKQRRSEERFYKKYPELVGLEEDVDRQADILAQRLGSKKLTQIPEDKVFAEVASMTKDYLTAQKKRLSKTTLHLEDGGVEEPPAPEPADKEEETTEEERMRRYFKDEVEAHNKRMDAV